MKKKVEMMRVFFLLFVFIASAFAEKQENEFSQLLEKLPSQEQLKEHLHIYKEYIWKSKFSKDVTVEEKKTFEHSAKLLKDAEVIVLKVRSQIKANKSIFDYPGLMAHGKISYNSDLKEYRLYIGFNLRISEGRGTSDFQIIINQHGLITEIKDMIWKR